jgi:hypothetical protein
MRIIEKNLVEETWQEVSRYPHERMAEESLRFFKRQPHAASFILASTGYYDETVQSMACYLAYVVFRMFEKSAEGRIPLISEEAVEDAFESNRNWLESIRDMDQGLLQRRLEFSEDLHQPFVIQYLVDALYEGGDEEEDSLNDISRTVILIVVKTFIDAVDNVTRS